MSAITFGSPGAAPSPHPRKWSSETEALVAAFSTPAPAVARASQDAYENKYLEAYSRPPPVFSNGDRVLNWMTGVRGTIVRQRDTDFYSVTYDNGGSNTYESARALERI